MLPWFPSNLTILSMTSLLASLVGIWIAWRINAVEQHVRQIHLDTNSNLSRIERELFQTRAQLAQTLATLAAVATSPRPVPPPEADA